MLNDFQGTTGTVQMGSARHVYVIRIFTVRFLRIKHIFAPISCCLFTILIISAVNAPSLRNIKIHCLKIIFVNVPIAPYCRCLLLRYTSCTKENSYHDIRLFQGRTQGGCTGCTCIPPPRVVSSNETPR